MNSSGQAVFRTAAVTSGLINQQQLEEALVMARAKCAGDSTDSGEISAEQLAEALIELGHLNRWQVAQLREGRTKFTLGPYRITDSIARGGMGHVFKGEHKMLGRIEAVKVLPKEKSTPAAVSSFRREIRAQAQLDHPNLVRITFADHDGDTFFFVSEYVSGTDLRRLVRRQGTLTMHAAATIISQAARGLDYAHARNLIHRDVKPGNLLVAADGRTKLADLGLSFFADEVELDVELSSTIAGTADYLAPEIIRDPKNVSPASDVYALGCTLYYAVTAKVPFPGGNTSAKLRRHLEQSPLNPRRFNSNLSDMFVDVIADMMDKNASSRIDSAREVIRRLKPWTLATANFIDEQGPLVDEQLHSQQFNEDSGAWGNPASLADTADSMSNGSFQIEPASSSEASVSTLRQTAWREDTDEVVPPVPSHAGETSPGRMGYVAILMVVIATLAVTALLTWIAVNRFW